MRLQPHHPLSNPELYPINAPMSYEELQSPGPTAILWSVCVHAVVIFVLFRIQKIMSTHTNPRGTRFRTISEFFFSIAWIVLSLENTFLFMWSEMGGVIALGLRLFLASLLFQKVFGNPCEALYYYLKCPPEIRRLSLFLRPFCAQMLAIPVGIATSLLIWNLLALTNDDYLLFLDKKFDYFLSVHPLIGFAIEASISFTVFLPGIVLPSSRLLRFLEPLLIMFLVHRFSMTTGAFMNPMVAMSSFLMWHSSSMEIWNLGIHLFVFFLGPVTGTLLAVGITQCCKRKHN